MNRKEINDFIDSLCTGTLKYSNITGDYNETDNIEEEPVDEPVKPEYKRLYGTATITIRFENRVQWQKYRMYILKTEWDFDGGDHPYTAQLKQNFTCVDDVEQITKKIVDLLQLGFDVYSCKWDLQKEDEQKVEYVQDGEIKRDVIKL